MFFWSENPKNTHFIWEPKVCSFDLRTQRMIFWSENPKNVLLIWEPKECSLTQPTAILVPYVDSSFIIFWQNFFSHPLSSKIHKMSCPIFRVVISSITISHINNNCRSVWWMSSWHLINMEEILSWRRNNFQVILSWNKLRKSWLYFPTDLLGAYKFWSQNFNQIQL